MTVNTQHRADEWRIAGWILASLAIVLLIASLSGTGTGMFGSGFMMGWMWLYMLLPFGFLALLALIIRERIHGG